MTTSRSLRERLFLSPFPYLLSDVLALMAAYYATWQFRFQSSWGLQLFTWINVRLGVRETGEVGPVLESFYWFNAPRILCWLALTLLFLYGFLNLYGRRRFIRRRYIARNVLIANLAALGLFYGYFYLTRNQFHPRSFFATMLALNVVIGLSFRQMLKPLLRRSGMARCRAILLGETEDARFIDHYLTASQPHGIEIVTRAPFNPDEKMESLLQRLTDLIKGHGTHLLVCADKRMSISQIMQLLQLSEELDQEVKVLSDKLAVVVNEADMPADFFRETPLVHFAVPSTRFIRARQATAQVLAAVLLLLASPVFLVIALLIKTNSRGGVFFTQERIGINRKPFRMFKFRTMYHRAEELQAQVEELNESGEGLFKIRRDPRVTPVGRFLRRFSLDELPQLINVLRGEMTLVGPRPLPRRDFENYYEEWHYSRHSGLPGLTCLWQISGRSDLSFHNMCILDDYYLRNRNMMLDLKIVMRTASVVLFAKGAY
ncbi:MAG: exopolysaccharide biosynthesis polyprenyl glycosylphosphotransferase [bacterium]